MSEKRKSTLDIEAAYTTQLIVEIGDKLGSDELVACIQNAVIGISMSYNEQCPQEKPDQYNKIMEMGFIVSLGRLSSGFKIVLPMMVLTHFGSIGVYVEKAATVEESHIVYNFIGHSDDDEVISCTYTLREVFPKSIIEIIEEVKRKNERSRV